MSVLRPSLRRSYTTSLLSWIPSTMWLQQPWTTASMFSRKVWPPWSCSSISWRKIWQRCSSPYNHWAPLSSSRLLLTALRRGPLGVPPAPDHLPLLCDDRATLVLSLQGDHPQYWRWSQLKRSGACMLAMAQVHWRPLSEEDLQSPGTFVTPCIRDWDHNVCIILIAPWIGGACLEYTTPNGALLLVSIPLRGGQLMIDAVYVPHSLQQCPRLVETFWWSLCKQLSAVELPLMLSIDANYPTRSMPVLTC